MKVSFAKETYKLTGLFVYKESGLYVKVATVSRIDKIIGLFCKRDLKIKRAVCM